MEGPAPVALEVTESVALDVDVFVSCGAYEVSNGCDGSLSGTRGTVGCLVFKCLPRLPTFPPSIFVRRKNYFF